MTTTCLIGVGVAVVGAAALALETPTSPVVLLTRIKAAAITDLQI